MRRRTIVVKRNWRIAISLAAAASSGPLYPLMRTGLVVPAHPGDDRERGMMSGRVYVRALSRAGRS